MYISNLNFIPRKYKDEARNGKIKRYETIVVILWITCIILYIFYFYNSNEINNKLGEKLNNNFNSMLTYKNDSERSIDTLRTLKELLGDIDMLKYRSVTIEKNNIDFDLSINNNKDYYMIVKQIENNIKYKITKLSPIIARDGEQSFQISIEVKL